MKQIIFGLVLSFIISVCLLPIIIKLLKKLACSQTILKYVEEHKSKQGTPTMGGLIFFIATFVLVFFFLDYHINWFICLLVAFFFGILGGMDDFIKIFFKRNLGLRPYQKIIGQIGISIIFALFVYYNIGTSINIPFFNKSVNVGWGIIPIVIITCLACTNAVNLTDGLDGLCGNVSVIVGFVTILILTILKQTAIGNNQSLDIINNYQNLSILLAIFIGSILGFLVYNTNKASIFMGDLGSMGIGGMYAGVFCVLGLEFSLLIVGIMYVCSALSVIIQVAVFKKTKKRVFKMSPLHHHFQQCGFSETKITFTYTMITLILGLLLVASYL